MEKSKNQMNEKRNVRKPKVTPLTETNNEPKPQLTKKELITQLIKKKTKEKFLTLNQKKYYDTLVSSEITIC